MSGRVRRDAVEAWWDTLGPDRCEFCHHTYQTEIGYYCADCDRPVCPVCVVTVRERHAVICPGCEQGGEED